MDYGYLHEVESVEFKALTSRPLPALLPVFESCGFTFHDDVVSLDRTGHIPPWQHSSVVEVDVRCKGCEVYGFDEGEWDSIQLKYLFASLPFELADQFVRAVMAVADKLGLSPTWNGQIVTAVELNEYFSRVREELMRETGEHPGSEGLAILIHSTYPRR